MFLVCVIRLMYVILNAGTVAGINYESNFVTTAKL